MPPPDAVSIRLLGPARAVAQCAQRLRAALAVTEESGDRPNRYSAGVRRYLTATALATPPAQVALALGACPACGSERAFLGAEVDEAGRVAVALGCPACDAPDAAATLHLVALDPSAAGEAPSGKRSRSPYSGVRS